MTTQTQENDVTSPCTETPVTATSAVQVTTGVELTETINPIWTQPKLPGLTKEKVKSEVINTEGFTLLRLKPAADFYPTAAIKDETGEFYMTACSLGRLLGIDKSNFTRMLILAPKGRRTHLRLPRKLAFKYEDCFDTLTDTPLALSDSTLDYNPTAASYYYTKEGIKYMLNQPTVQKHLDKWAGLKNFIYNEFYTRFLTDKPLITSTNFSVDPVEAVKQRAAEDIAQAAAIAAFEKEYPAPQPHSMHAQRVYVQTGVRALVDNISDFMRSVDALTEENAALRQQLEAQPQAPVAPEYDNSTATAEDKLKHSIYISEKYGSKAFGSEWLAKCGWLTSESIYNMPVPNTSTPSCWVHKIGGVNRITLSVFQAIVRSVFLKGSSYPFNKVKQEFIDNGMVRNFYVVCEKKPYPGPVLQSNGCIASPETPTYDTNSHLHIQPSTRYSKDAVEYLRKNWLNIVTDYMADTMVRGANSINAKYADDQEEDASSE